MSGRVRAVLLGLVCWAPALELAAADEAGWITVDYAPLVDRRALSHSGESVGVLLARLAGRPLPAPGERPADRIAYGWLEPLVEPYGFALSDALDALDPGRRERPLVEVGSLWQPGEPQPAWVELLRARRFVVESDGAGSLRLALPWRGDTDPARATIDSAQAAREALAQAWPVVRHVLAAEARRLARAGGPAPALAVEVHAYRHEPQRSTFELGRAAERLVVDDFRPDGRQPPLDLGAWSDFLGAGLELEGGRLEPSGQVRLFGSRVREPASLLGSPLSLADFAVAYRAVSHGGLAEPYMSLDRGPSPMRHMVSYGGRLRDTGLGLVSLRCDIRFKTFSLGLDIERGLDLRERLRAALPDFRTHLERFAASPDHGAAEQTRLWFYPDAVDLMLSEQGDVLVLRRVRMSAAAERMGASGSAGPEREVRAWTRATVEAVNRDYEVLAGFFPELSDLDRVVRLLSFFTWLRRAEGEGRLVPELDALLAVELPALSTPRTYPQLIAFNALPKPESAAAVEVYDRVEVGEALERLNPSGGRPLPASRRLARALAALDPTRPEQARLAEELKRAAVPGLDDSALDLLAERAERIRLHETVLQTLDAARRRALSDRIKQGESLQMFSVAIGGLDLGMSSAVERARGTRIGLTSGTEAAGGPVSAAPSSATPEPNAAWRVDPPGLPQAVLPAHGLPPRRSGGPLDATLGQHLVSVGAGRVPGTSFELEVYGLDSPEPRSRRLEFDSKGLLTAIERVDERGFLRYRVAREAARLSLVPLDVPSVAAATGGSPPLELPAGLVALRLGGAAAPEAQALSLRIDSRGADGRPAALSAEFPRALLQRLVRGPGVDLTPNQPLAGLSPLPVGLGQSQAVMVLSELRSWLPPWDAPREALPGEEDGLRLARALDRWWAAAAAEGPRAVVGVDEKHSPERWARAPRPAAALLLLPEDGFPGPMAASRAALASAWGQGPIAEALPERLTEELVVLIEADTPPRCGERLAGLALDPRMRGRLLAAWCLAGPVREDLPRRLLEPGILAGVGLAEDSLLARREAEATLAALALHLAEPGAHPRPERLGGPFLWYY